MNFFPSTCSQLFSPSFWRIYFRNFLEKSSRAWLWLTSDSSLSTWVKSWLNCLRLKEVMSRMHQFLDSLKLMKNSWTTLISRNACDSWEMKGSLYSPISENYKTITLIIPCKGRKWWEMGVSTYDEMLWVWGRNREIVLHLFYRSYYSMSRLILGVDGSFHFYLNELNDYIVVFLWSFPCTLFVFQAVFRNLMKWMSYLEFQNSRVKQKFMTWCISDKFSKQDQIKVRERSYLKWDRSPFSGFTARFTLINGLTQFTFYLKEEDKEAINFSWSKQ